MTRSATEGPREGLGTGREYDVFVDLTRCFGHTAAYDHLDRLGRAVGLAPGVGRITVAMTPTSETAASCVDGHVDADVGEQATVQLARAITRATALGHHLVVVLGAVIPGSDVLFALIEAFELDPLFGTAQPRFAHESSNQIWPLPDRASEQNCSATRLSREVLPLLRPVTITPELLAACVVLRWDLLVTSEAANQGYVSAEGALLQLLSQGRRRGFRNVVVNHAVLPSSLPYHELYPGVTKEDGRRLLAASPDHALADAELARLTERRLERLLAAAHPDTDSQRRVLLDCRSVGPHHNGAAECVLGFLSGFAALAAPERIDILVRPDAAKFHDLAQRYPAFRQVHERPTGEYFGAVCLTHPWALTDVADLHRHALLIAFTMLDTIGWDVLYTDGASTVADVWRFIARHADGLLYISSFTRDRFRTRFPPSGLVVEQVTHLSLAQDEHIDPIALAEPVADHLLIFGNELDHKDLRPTLRLLVDAFPFNRIVAFGIAESPSPNVVAIPSGRVGQGAVHRLLASARAIVYPSVYEGFGLPVVEALSYGRPVIVRRSPLWREIAGWSRLPGDLIEFDDAASLVEAVGRVLAGLPIQALPSGVALSNGARPSAWRDCAGRVMALLNQCLATADGRRWCEREEALRIAGL